MATDDLWTLDELVQRVTDALAGAEYPGAPNGRVRDVPDRRAVRWYATIGLVDRPAATRGRTALYGSRHLLQLVAVKRRQAQGRSLADIQAELTGATDTVLRRIAEVPEGVFAPAGTSASVPQVPARPRFWAERPSVAAIEPAAEPSHDTLTGVPLDGGAVLLLPVRPGADDLPAIQAAARPLLDVLAERGLLPPVARRSPR